MKILLPSLVFLLGLFSACTHQKEYSLPPSTEWSYTLPEEQGMRSEDLYAAYMKLAQMQLDMHSVTIIRNNAVINEIYYSPYSPEVRHHVYSCTKSVVSTLVGIAIDKGYIKDVHQQVLSFFPGETFRNMSERKRAMTLEHLLTMTAGFEWDEWSVSYADPQNPINDMWRHESWYSYVLDQPVVSEPGSVFNYNSGVSHLLSVILERASGMSADAFARKYLFDTLNITDYEWVADPEGYSVGGWGLWIKPRDFAKIGQLILNDGMWKQKRILSQEWITSATRRHVAISYLDADYGYQWWIHGDDIVSASGRGGQYLFLSPQKKLIAVINSASTPSETVLLENWYRDSLYTAASSHTPLPPDGASFDDLRRELYRQAVPGRGSGDAIPGTFRKISGKQFVFQENPAGILSVSFSFDAKEAALHVEYENGFSEKASVGLHNEAAITEFVNGGYFPVYPSRFSGSYRDHRENGEFVIMTHNMGEIRKEELRFRLDGERLTLNGHDYESGMRYAARGFADGS